MIGAAEVEDGVRPADLDWTAGLGGAVTVRHRARSARRTVVYLNHYGGAQSFHSWVQQRGFMGHHLWGCLELAARGWKVILPRIVNRFGKRSERYLADAFIASCVFPRLGPEDIVYCASNLLHWIPRLSRLRRGGPKLVSLLNAKEPLPFARQQDGIVALTGAAAEHARTLAPHAKIAHIPWGIEFSPKLAPSAYQPRWGLASGVTHRDLSTIRQAFHNHPSTLKVCNWGRVPHAMPATVEFLAFVSHEDLYAHWYRHAAYVLICLQKDSECTSSAGYTSMLEAMALARPVIKTRTGALDREIDVEAEGFGLYVAPEDPGELRQAIEYLERQPHVAEEMGRRGRELCERRFTIGRFGKDLDLFFSRL